MWQVRGHQKALRFFKNSINEGKITHACLLVGAPHIGKMTLAINLAQALNCQEEPPPCGNCQSCRRIAALNHADVRVVSLKSDDDLKPFPRIMISKEQIERIRHSTSLTPYEGRTRVFIIDGAENMSLGAANCFLKTLEEPSDKIVFVLLAVNESRLTETIASRCQHIELFPIAAVEIEEELKNRGVSEEKARLLSRLSHGRMGWAITAAEDDSLLENRKECIEKTISLINDDYEERFGYATQLARQFNKEREAVWNTIELWLDLWRDIILLKMGLDEDIINIDFEEELLLWSKEFTVDEIRKVMEDIIETEQKLKRNASPQLALEVLMLNIPLKEGVAV